MSYKVFICAGEASGDALGAALIEQLQQKLPELDTFGMGGDRMRAQGFRALHDIKELNVMGLVEVLKHLRRLFKLKDSLAEKAIAEKPDVAVLIDVPDFNRRLAKQLKAAGIRVVYYVGPSVWAWRSGRVYSFKQVIDHMMVLFPFETQVWQDAGVSVACVGHPLLDESIPEIVSTEKRAKTVALLPGSRRSEVMRHFQTMLQAARKLYQEGLVERFVVPVAPTLDRAWLLELAQEEQLAEQIEFIEDSQGQERRKAVRNAAMALVVSGTASLETALVGTAQVIFYKASWLSHRIWQVMVKVEHFGLPNILAGKEVAPELLQDDVTTENLYEAAKKILLDSSARELQEQEYLSMRKQMGDHGAAARAAQEVIRFLEAKA